MTAGPRDPIPIEIRLRGAVEPLGRRVGVTGEIEPVTRPALAELRRGQQPFDEPFVGQRRSVGEKPIELTYRRDSPRQIQRDSSQKRRVVRRRGRLDVVGLPVARQQLIDLCGDLLDIASQLRFVSVSARKQEQDQEQTHK